MAEKPKRQVKKKDEEGQKEVASVSENETAAQSAEPEKVGSMLRRVRLEKKQDLKDVASYLCIRYQFLEAIEEDRQKELPGETYAAGFVRSYAAYLGLDAAEIVSKYKSELASNKEKKSQRMEMMATEPESSVPGLKTILISLVLLILAYGFWKSFSGTDVTESPYNTVETVLVTEENYPPEMDVHEVVESTSKPVPPVPPKKPSPPAEEKELQSVLIREVSSSEQEGSEIAVEEKKIETAPETIRVYGQKNYNPRVVMIANDETWVEITRGEMVLLSRILNKGDRYQASRNPDDLYLKTGNAGGLDIYVDGQLVPGIGPRGATRTRIPLDPDYLIPKTSEEY